MPAVRGCFTFRLREAMVVGVGKVRLRSVSDEDGHGSGTIGGSGAFEHDFAAYVEEQRCRYRHVCRRRRAADSPRVEIRGEIGREDRKFKRSRAGSSDLGHFAWLSDGSYVGVFGIAEPVGRNSCHGIGYEGCSAYEERDFCQLAHDFSSFLVLFLK